MSMYYENRKLHLCIRFGIYLFTILLSLAAPPSNCFGFDNLRALAYKNRLEDQHTPRMEILANTRGKRYVRQGDVHAYESGRCVRMHGEEDAFHWKEIGCVVTKSGEKLIIRFSESSYNILYFFDLGGTCVGVAATDVRYISDEFTKTTRTLRLYNGIVVRAHKDNIAKQREYRYAMMNALFTLWPDIKETLPELNPIDVAALVKYGFSPRTSYNIDMFGGESISPLSGLNSELKVEVGFNDKNEGKVFLKPVGNAALRLIKQSDVLQNGQFDIVDNFPDGVVASKCYLHTTYWLMFALRRTEMISAASRGVYYGNQHNTFNLGTGLVRLPISQSNEERAKGHIEALRALRHSVFYGERQASSSLFSQI